MNIEETEDEKEKLISQLKSQISILSEENISLEQAIVIVYEERHIISISFFDESEIKDLWW